MAEYNAEIIDMSEYERSGEGANGESYNHKTNPLLMVKLYGSSADTDVVYMEYENARKVHDSGIPSPEPGCFITDGKGRYGIKFTRLVNKVSYARAVGNNPEQVEKYARMFASMCRKLHSTHLPAGSFPSVKDQYLSLLANNHYWTEQQREFMDKVIRTTPDADTALHGDLQFGNLLLVDGESYFIDLGEFAIGHPYFDLSMVLICCVLNDESFIKEFFHMSAATAREFWKYFVDAYFDGKLTEDEAYDLLFPYAMVKCLLIERNLKGSLDKFHELFREHYGF